jgi:two-component sensor histidine kinase
MVATTTDPSSTKRRRASGVPLAARLVVLMLLVSVPLVVVEVVLAARQIEARDSEILADTFDANQLAAVRVSGFIESIRTLLVAAAQMTSVRERDAQACHVQLGELAARFPQIAGIAAFDAAGAPICASSTQPQVSIEGRAYYRAALATREFYADDYLVGVSGQGGVVFAYPSIGADGEVQVLTRATITTESLSHLFETLAPTPGAWFTLIDRKGAAIARWPDADIWVGRDLSATPRVQEALARPVGVGRMEAPDVGDGEFAIAHIRLAPGYFLLHGHALTEVLAAIRASALAEVLTILAVLAAATALSVAAAYRWVLAPITALGAAARTMATAKFDALASEPAALPEVRRLARQFADMTTVLEQRRIRLEQALRDKELLMQEANHRVKNSLQLVAGLLTLHSTVDDPHARAQLEQVRLQVLTVARVHERLYRDETVTSVAFNRFLDDLCNDLQRAVAGPHSIACRAAELRLPTSVAIPLGMIINELVVNALKHAYDVRPGEIRVTVEQQGGELVATVADDGRRLPPDFDPRGRAGLGLRTVDMLVRQLHGTMTIQPRERGKDFVVRIPAPASGANG